MKKQNIVSWIALALSIIACIITWVRVDVYFTNDTFVGIMAGFMGACTTILVGAQIYNQIENKKQIEKTRKLQELLNKDLESSKSQWTKSEKRIEALLQYTHGIALYDENPIYTFEYLYSALKSALLYCTPNEINHIMHDLNATSIQIEKKFNEKVDNRQKIYYSIKPEEMEPESLSEYPYYALIHKNYSEAYKRYYKIISSYKDSKQTYDI